MAQIPQEYRERAIKILENDPDALQSEMDSIRKEIPDKPELAEMKASWNRLVDYLLSSDVPLSRKTLVLGGILWSAFPKNLLGSVDNFVVSLIISKELKKFHRGEYRKTTLDASYEFAKPVAQSRNRFFFPELC